MKARKSRENTPVAQTVHFAMGTVMTYKAFGPRAERALAAARHEVARIEGLLSRYLPESDISRINGAAGVGSERVSLETFAILSQAVAFAQVLPGCFDVTIGPLVTLWQAGKAASAEPDEESLRQARRLVNYRDLILDPEKATAGLARAGQSLDLGGAGKGHAADRILEILRAFGITSAYANLGGNVVTLGARPDGRPWRIGIQHPRHHERLLGAVEVVDQAVVTSGGYLRCFTDSQGKSHHHILSPTTGYPADSGLISVSIVADTSVAADILSTMVFVAGLDRGLEVLRACPSCEAVIVDSDLHVYATQGLKHRFEADSSAAVHALE